MDNKQVTVEECMSFFTDEIKNELNELCSKYQPMEGDKYIRRLLKYVTENTDRVNILLSKAGMTQESNILDIGCGSGYLLYILNNLGYKNTTGMDMGDNPLFTGTIQTLGVNRISHTIEKFKPLPKFPSKYDIIFAGRITFNFHRRPGLWGEEEWEYFMTDIKENVLTPGGKIILKFNSGSDMPKFLRTSMVIDKKTILVDY